MNITSLLITLAGIIVILALYIMSRVTQSKLPTKQTAIIPDLKDDNGDRFTSVLDDIPARDGSTPKATPVITEEIKEKEPQETTEEPLGKKVKQKQSILFISGKDESGLDGNLVQLALEKNGFVFGEMDIYHYLINNNSDVDSEKISLFRIANGMEPWTLKEEDLLNKKLAGLSVVMQTPSKIDDNKAINTFITVTESLCIAVDGVLKNQQQQLFTDENKENLIASVK